MTYFLRRTYIGRDFAKATYLTDLIVTALITEKKKEASNLLSIKTLAGTICKGT